MLRLANNNINHIQFGDVISNLPSLRFLGVVNNQLPETNMAQILRYNVKTDWSRSLEFQKLFYKRPSLPSFCEKTRTIKLGELS